MSSRSRPLTQASRLGTWGDYTSIGAGACLKSCVVEHTVDIGEGCVIDQGAVVQNTWFGARCGGACGCFDHGGRWAATPLPRRAAAGGGRGRHHGQG